MRVYYPYLGRRHFFKRCLGGWLAALSTLSAVSTVRRVEARSPSALRSIAFFYGASPDFSALSRYQFAVLEPGGDFMLPQSMQTQWLAYVSVGEATPAQAYYPAIPKAWIVGTNTVWNSELIDQSAPGWPAFFVEHVVAPLWLRGYTGFFMDTLDSYQLFARDDRQRLRNQRGLIAVIAEISRCFPAAKIVLNRGFELLPQVHDRVYAVAFESLFETWSEERGVYTTVSADDRDWLLSQADIARHEYGLPVIAIDYCAPADIACARRTVRRIRERGLVPYVGDGHLQTLSLAALA